MGFKKILLFLVFLFSFPLFTPKVSNAYDFGTVLDSGETAVVKIYEGIEYIFTFRIENKVTVLEKHAEKRLVNASEYADSGNEEGVQNQLEDYLQIKEKQNNLLDKIENDDDVLGMIQEKTIEQQKTMEEIKTKVGDEAKHIVVQTQEQVVNQVAERVVVTNGTEGQTEFFQKVEHVWAPGTGPGGGPSGVVIEGGSMQFAPGTSKGGPAGSDIKTNVVVTGGGGENNVVEGGGGGLAPGTTSGGGDAVNTIDPGTVDPGNSPGDSDWVIDP